MRTFPHCDQRILHAPGQCEYCDLSPEMQEMRLAWGVCFTGFQPDYVNTWVMCPADVARPTNSASDHRQWPGNTPEGYNLSG